VGQNLKYRKGFPENRSVPVVECLCIVVKIVNFLRKMPTINAGNRRLNLSRRKLRQTSVPILFHRKENLIFKTKEQKKPAKNWINFLGIAIDFFITDEQLKHIME
jgi:hypothetical protein